MDCVGGSGARPHSLPQHILLIREPGLDPADPSPRGMPKDVHCLGWFLSLPLPICPGVGS